MTTQDKISTIFWARTYISPDHGPHIANMYEPTLLSVKVTHPALHIRNASDALVVLEAVRRGILPLISLRLSSSDRDQLKHGNVFVWEESQSEGGLVRWTDGRRWSQSKVFGECLFYEEKVEATEQEREAKAMRRVQRICNPGTNIPPPRRNQRPSKCGGLTKQTYSFLVRLPGSCESRKWHTVAYTLWSDRASLPVIDEYPVLRDIRVPVGVFARSKASDTVTTYLSTQMRPVNREGSCGAISATSTPPGPVRTFTYNDPNLPALGPKLPSFSPRSEGGAGMVLPPVSWIQPLTSGQAAAPNFPGVPTDNWHPMSQEDRRMLDSFRLML
ncbi:Gti1/Pac2 family-domain-containing protein [Mycena vulgaris]|nr:Gti1/Pac2 family-domain-containing protein [Mycena vulgaris]